MNPEDVKSIQIGLTTRCNAKCPLCMRTKYPPVMKDIDIEHLKTIPKMELVVLCSGNGEPTLYPKFFEAVSILKETGPKLKIHTNGTTHNEIWWESLGNGLRQSDFIVFPLDGLEDTYSKYRVGLSFKKAIKNIEAFTNAGGTVECHTLIFKHNEHQMDEIEKLAYDIGCKQHFKKISWYYTKEFEKTGNFDLLSQHHQSYCFHLNGEFVIDVNGRYWPCNFVSNEVELERNKVKDITNQDFILKVKYLKSKDKMFTIEDAMQTPLYNYVMENVFKIEVCKDCSIIDCRTVI